ncbi:glycosyltransferase family 61 protein [Pseudomonas sp. BNK-45]|uniref:glycosyltransferase family 61 protein n=1 Tax=Pseudomonas sp. BNK-45 TaxID=3376180 RepID=UPI0039BFA9A9
MNSFSRSKAILLKTFYWLRLIGFKAYCKVRLTPKTLKARVKKLFYSHLHQYKLFKLIRLFIRLLSSFTFKITAIITHGFRAKKYNLISRSEFINLHNIKNVEFYSGGFLDIAGPKFIGSYEFKPIGSEGVRLEQPKIDIVFIENSTVMGGTNYIIVNDTIVHPDQYIPSRDVCPAELNGIAKLNLDENTTSLYTGKIREIKKAISLLGCCTGNYAHWLTETLPKLLFIDSLNGFDDYPLLVDHWIHPNFVDSINLVKKIDRQLIRVSRWESIYVESLVDISPTAYVPPEHRFFHEKKKLCTPCSSDFPFSYMALNLLKARALQALKIENPEGKQKIFLHRSKENSGNTRYVKNTDAIAELIKSYGYIFLDPATLSFNEQVVAFSTASHIVSPLGAALSNMIFSPQGCKVIGLSPYYENANYYYFSNFMGVLGHQLRYVLGPQVSKSGHILHRDYEIDIDALKLALEIINQD